MASHIRLGTFVASPNFRHPVPFAKELATVDEIAGGRLILGVGSGGTGFDAFVLGQAELTPRQRHERFAEFVERLDALLRFETGAETETETKSETEAAATDTHGFSFEGEWYTAQDARMVGTPAQSPRLPFVLAANGPKGLALVARFGQGWVTTGPEGRTGEEWWSAVAELAGRLDDAATASGRDPGTIDRYLSLDSGGTYSLSSVGAFQELSGRAGELGFTDVIAHWPRRDGIYAGSEDVLVEAASRLS